MNLVALSPNCDQLFVANNEKIFSFPLYHLYPFIYSKKRGPEASSVSTDNNNNNNNNENYFTTYSLPIPRGRVDREEINQIRSGFIGGEPILLAVYDSGIVAAIFISNADQSPKQRDPIILENDGLSTWSLACGCANNSKRMIAVGSNSHDITLWDLSVSDVSSSSFMTREADEQVIRDDELQSRRAEGLSNKRTLKGHAHNIPAIDLSECGRFIVSASIDRSVCIWRTCPSAVISNRAYIARKKICAEWGWSCKWFPRNMVDAIPKHNVAAWREIDKMVRAPQFDQDYMQVEFLHHHHRHYYFIFNISCPLTRVNIMYAGASTAFQTRKKMRKARTTRIQPKSGNHRRENFPRI